MPDVIASPEAFRGRATPKLDQKPSPVTAIVFIALLAAGLGYGAHGLLDDIRSVHEPLAMGAFLLLGIALGLGTMVGWKRIVVTVGERIGKTHLTYAQGASAEMVAALTIGAAEIYGLPVSTTHILSSGVAGTMAANGSGLQWSTVRSIAMAWVLTLPAAMAIAGGLYFILRQFV
jgi:phosphate/sulfate permease